MNVVVKCKNFYAGPVGGTVQIELDCKPLTKEQEQVIEQLFPNTGERVEDLLTAEALIASIAKPSDLIPPKDDQVKKKY